MLVLLQLLPVTPSLRAIGSRAEVVTWADFSRISYITSSTEMVYFATTEGIIRYNKMERRWEEPMTGVEGIDDRQIKRIWTDLFGEKLYAETSTGLYENDLVFDRWDDISELPELNVNYAHVKPPEILYAPSGYNYFPEGYLSDGWGRNFEFTDIVEDRSGTLWLGTWGLGPVSADIASGMMELLPHGLIQNRVNTIYDDDGVLWVGGANLGGSRTGISIFDTRNGTFEHIESGLNNDFPAEDINCLAGAKNDIYAGTSQGLIVFDRSTLGLERRNRRTSLRNENILCVAPVGDSLFVGTEDGLTLIAGDEDSIKYVRPGRFLNTQVYDLEVTSNALWIASSVGAYQLEFGSGRLRQLTDPDQIATGTVYAVARYADFIWFVSNVGLVRLNLKTGDTQPFVSLSSSFRGRALAVNDRVAAVSSDRGLVIFFLEKDGRYHEREFTVDDGLPSNYVFDLLLDGDHLWIGSDRGLTRFLWNDPNRID